MGQIAWTVLTRASDGHQIPRITNVPTCVAPSPWLPRSEGAVEREPVTAAPASSSGLESWTLDAGKLQAETLFRDTWACFTFLPWEQCVPAGSELALGDGGPAHLNYFLGRA